MKKILLAFLAAMLLLPSLFAGATLTVPVGTDPDAETKGSVENINSIESKKKEHAACMTNTKGDKAYCDCVMNGGVKLNTNVPFIGKCINKDNTGSGSTTSTAFTDLIGGLSKIVVTVILIVSFMMIIVGGVMRTTGNAAGGKKLLMKVVIGLAILGASGAILRLINPNFFQ